MRPLAASIRIPTISDCISPPGRRGMFDHTWEGMGFFSYVQFRTWLGQTRNRRLITVSSTEDPGAPVLGAGLHGVGVLCMSVLSSDRSEEFGDV